MNIAEYTHCEDFFSDHRDIILTHVLQAELVYLNARGPTGAAGFYGAAVRAGQNALLAVQRPPYPMIFFQTGHTPLPPARRMVTHIIQTGRIPAMINGNVSSTQSIIRAFAEQGVSYRAGRRLIQRKCETLANVPVKNLPLVAAKDTAYDFATDYRGFLQECHAFHNPDKLRQDAENLMRGGDLFVLIDQGAVVTMGRLQRSLPDARAVGVIYTPPRYRGMGYATCCTKQLTRRVLGDGYQYAYLYADSNNPAANHIYEKLGYAKTDTFVEYHRVE